MWRSRNTVSKWHKLVVVLLSLSLLMLNAANDELERTAHVQRGASLGIGRHMPDLPLHPLNQPRTTLATLLTGHRGVVLAMTSCGCPLSKKYAPRLAALETEFSDSFAFAYVNTVSSESTDDMRSQIREYGFDGPYLPDRDNAIARALGARTTTEVFVIDGQRRLAYRGAVDDQYGVGTALNAPRNEYLRNALRSIHTGKAPAASATWSPGCLLDLPLDDWKTTGAVSYFGEVANILAERCVSCHRRGGIAPFSLESHGLLRGRASMIEAVVRDGLMPPWHGVEPRPDGTSPWANDRAVPVREREVLLSWLRAGMPLGERKPLPALEPLSQTWIIGRPDLLLSSASIALPRTGPLVHRRLIVATHLETERWIQSFEFRPAKIETVHHAVVWLMTPGCVFPSPMETPGDLEFFGTYSPGDSTVTYPPGTARRLPAGSVLVADLYARPMDEVMSTRLRIGMRFANTPPATAIETMSTHAKDFTVGAGTAAVRHTLTATLHEDTQILALTPYARARAKVVTLSLNMPDGENRELLYAPRYDYRWQIRYVLEQPLSLPAGTQLRLDGVFDNTAANPNNPDANATATAGPAANQETLLLAIEFGKRQQQ